MYGLMCQCVIRVSCYKNHHGTLNLTFEALSYRCCRCRLVCALDVSVCTQLHRRGQAVELHRPARCDVSSAPCAGGLSTCFTSPQQAPRRWPCGHHANPDFCLRYPFTVDTHSLRGNCINESLTKKPFEHNTKLFFQFVLCLGPSFAVRERTTSLSRLWCLSACSA